jgi:hypothetical protein
MHLAYLDGMSGVPGAEALLRDLIRYADARGYWTDVLESRYLLGALLQHRGAIDDARREFDQVLSMAVSYGNKLVANDAREALAKLG